MSRHFINLTITNEQTGEDHRGRGQWCEVGETLGAVSATFEIDSVPHTVQFSFVPELRVVDYDDLRLDSQAV